MNKVKSKNQNQLSDVPQQQPGSPQSPIQRVFIIGVLTITIVGIALVMIKMGKVMANDLGEISV